MTLKTSYNHAQLQGDKRKFVSKSPLNDTLVYTLTSLFDNCMTVGH